MENNTQLPRIITLSGEPGAGKTTVLNHLKNFYEKKGFTVETHLVGQIFRQIADSLGIPVAELNKNSACHPEIDKMLDDELKEYSAKINSSPSENTVYLIDSRMAWEFVDNSFSVRLTVPTIDAGKRIFADSTRSQTDKYSCLEDAIEQTATRKKAEIDKYRRLYGVDLSDPNNYQLVIDTKDSKPSKIAELINVCFNLHGSGKFFPKMWQGIGGSVMPSKEQPVKRTQENIQR